MPCLVSRVVVDCDRGWCPSRPWADVDHLDQARPVAAEQDAWFTVRRGGRTVDYSQPAR